MLTVVFAGNYKEFVNHCNSKGLRYPAKDHLYVAVPDIAYKLRGKYLVEIIGSFWDRRDVPQFLKAFKAAGINLEEIVGFEEEAQAAHDG